MAGRTQLLYPVARIGVKAVASCTVSASLAAPWRTLETDGERLSGEIIAHQGYRTPGIWEVFKGELDNPRGLSSGQGKATARSLPALRKKVGPQAFQDATLETVLNWIGGQVGQPLKLTVSGDAQRHYTLREGSAWSAIKAALLSWRRTDYVTIELDDYSLYIGPEEQSPHATAPLQATLEHLINIYRLRRTAKGAEVDLPAYPWLRVGHRVQFVHPSISGVARIVEVVTLMTRKNTLSTVEVVLL